MKRLTNVEAKNVVGGASKYVYCEICGYKYKTSLWERLFKKDVQIRGELYSTHGQARNGWGRNQSQSAHR